MLKGMSEGSMVAHRSELESLGASIFDRYNVYSGAAFANHCRRLGALARLLFRQHGLSAPAGSLELLSYIHDLGLVLPQLPGASYMHRSLHLLRSACADRLDSDGGGWGWSRRELDELLLLNHRVFAPSGASRAAELYRRAVWIEHSRGLRRYGLAHSEIREVFLMWPRLDLDRVLLDFGRRTLLKEPTSLVRGVFFGAHPGES